MRGILFRGKRKDNGKWIYGDLLTPTEFVNVYEISEYAGTGSRSDVIPETVGEYTGLTDKNCKKIFEGDIVRLTPPKESGEVRVPTPRNPNEDRIVEVVFYKGMFAFDMCKWIKCGYGKCGLHSYETERLEVIGNIHDNPELLEEKRK